MPLEEVVLRHSVFVAHNDFVDFQREIELRLESGGTATLVFPNAPPTTGCNSRDRTRQSSWRKTNSRMYTTFCKRKAGSSLLR